MAVTVYGLPLMASVWPMIEGLLPRRFQRLSESTAA